MSEIGSIANVHSSRGSWSGVILSLTGAPGHFKGYVIAPLLADRNHAGGVVWSPDIESIGKPYLDEAGQPISISIGDSVTVASREATVTGINGEQITLEVTIQQTKHLQVVRKHVLPIWRLLQENPKLI